MSVQGGSDGRIFISYRRAESGGGLAGRLYDRLVAHFGKEQVFMDVDSIEPGMDFGDVIREAVGSCDVLLAMIGSEWITATDSSGRRRRLDDPADLVRLEIEAALVRKVRLIPVLTNGATMPRPSDLPESMAPLAGRNAVPLRHDSFAGDVKHLVEVLDRVLTGGPPAPVATAARIDADHVPTTAAATPTRGRDPNDAQPKVARNEPTGISPSTTRKGGPAAPHQRSADTEAGRSSANRPTGADLVTSDRGAANKRGIALMAVGVSLALVALGSWWLLGRSTLGADVTPTSLPAVASTVAAADSEAAGSAPATQAPLTVSTVAGASSADSTAAPSPVQIQAPANGESVPSPLLVSGTASVPAGMSMWVVIKPPDGNYYLTTKAPVEVAASGAWATQVGVGRGTRDAGIVFDIYAVFTPVTGSQFSLWVADEANGYGPFSTLPVDTTPVTTVRLTLQ